MVGHRYATVPGYLTIGGGIVQAVKVDNKRVALTGVITEIDPKDWPPVDSLEGGYDRIKVRTHGGEEVWMYAEKSYKKQKDTGSDATGVAKTTPSR